MIDLLLADDHTLVRHGLISLLSAAPDCRVVAEASDGEEAVALALSLRPRVAILDLHMPRLSGKDAVRRIQAEAPEVRLLVLTMHEEEEYVIDLVRAGASGYLLKDSAATELLAAVRALAAGKSYFGPYAAQVLAEQTRKPKPEAVDPYGSLTAREREVFHLIVQGASTKAIASRLDISAKTAENHRTRALAKLKARNTAELVRYAARHGLLD